MNRLETGAITGSVADHPRLVFTIGQSPASGRHQQPTGIWLHLPFASMVQSSCLLIGVIT
jgi:hypothetical protein